MVAISLYRGNLHRVPDVPRRWPMPPPAISPRDFRFLLFRRSRALSLLDPPAESAKPSPPAPPPRAGREEEGMGDNGCPKPRSAPESSAASRPEGMAGKCEGGGAREGEIGPTCPASTSTASGNVKREEDGENAVGDVGAGGKMEASYLDIVNDTEKQKRELEKKLDILNQKKHHLVQMLKQILNAEEEIKKSISVQPPLVRSSIPLQADGTTETSSVMKLAASKMNIEVNFGSDVGVGGEPEEIARHNTQLPHSQHMYNTSPSSASAFNRPSHGFLHHNLVNTPCASSTSTGTTSNMLLSNVTASPSRFAPPGHQGHPTNLPPISISGSHLFASSPSPAASGGASSVFRDSRLTSP